MSPTTVTGDRSFEFWDVLFSISEYKEHFIDNKPRPEGIAFLVIFITSIIVLSIMFMPKDKSNNEHDNQGSAKTRQFVPKVKLSPKDQIVLDMLDPLTNNFVICDPSLADLPIVYASEAFCKFTQYKYEEIVGRNCRFLQGTDTDKIDIAKIRNAISANADENVNLLNYKKDGTPFINEFFICPLKAEKKGKPSYYLGVQHEVSQPGNGQYIENPGWVYTFGSHQ